MSTSNNISHESNDGNDSKNNIQQVNYEISTDNTQNQACSPNTSIPSSINNQTNNNSVKTESSVILGQSIEIKRAFVQI